MTAATSHIRTTHPTFHPFEASFGTRGLESLIPHATLHAGDSHSVCTTCSAILPSLAAAESHLLSTPVHAAAVAVALRERGTNALHTMLPSVRVAVRDPPPDAPLSLAPCSPPAVARVNNWIYGANPSFVSPPLPVITMCQEQLTDAQTIGGSPAQLPVVPDGGPILLRILLGPRSGGTLQVERDTVHARLAGLLEAALPRTLQWAGVVAAGMRFVYASRKMAGGAAEILVRGEREWRRLMGDVVDGGRADWVA